MPTLCTQDIMIFGEWIASCLKNLLPEKGKGNIKTKQPRFKSRLNKILHNCSETTFRI